jgi:uncharacterized glyoxalase superfamily protein PhnB
MVQVVALRPFVPARDFAMSKLFYQALGCAITYDDAAIAIFKQDSFSFILQNYYVKEFADNCMLQLVVTDVDAWWRAHVDAETLAESFGVKSPRPPVMQAWGMKVGFVFDPSGVLWHVAEAVDLKTTPDQS